MKKWLNNTYEELSQGWEGFPFSFFNAGLSISMEHSVRWCSVEFTIIRD